MALKQLTAEEWDDLHEKADEFSKDFARLVRKYLPAAAGHLTHKDQQLLAMLQDRTSCYNPLVWDSEFDPEES